MASSERMTAEHNLTIRKAFESRPTGTNAVVREVIEATSSDLTDAGSKDKATGFFSVTLPMGVKLLLLAAGSGALLLVIWLIRRSSAAADAAFRVADQGAAVAISHVENALATTTDPTELSKLNALRATLEKERGKLTKKR